MTDALPDTDRAITEDEKLTRACDWSDYRKAYGVSPDEAKLKQEHQLFCAGWDAARRGGWDTKAIAEKPVPAESEVATMAKEPIDRRLRRAFMNGFREGVEMASWRNGQWDFV
jgi:hypothetical protein